MSVILTITTTILGLILLALISIRFFVVPANSPKWIQDIPIAHRGLFAKGTGVPENSLVAFEKAIDQGYAIELDVWLTKDKDVVVFHDQDLERMTGDAGKLKETTLTDLRTYRLEGTTQGIPTLKEVLDLVAGRVPLYIEIKVQAYQEASDIEPKVASILDQYAKDYDHEGRGYFAVISFNPRTIAWFAANRPSYIRGQSYDAASNQDDTAAAQFMRVVSWSLDSKPSFIVYDHEELQPIAQRALSYLFSMVSFHVNSQEQADHANLYADNIIFETIRPKVL